MEEHEHAMQRAAELADSVYNGTGGRAAIALADVYIAMARELRIGTYRMTTGRGGGPKYPNVKVVIPQVAPNVLEEDEPPEEDTLKVVGAETPTPVDLPGYPPVEGSYPVEDHA